MAKDLKDSKDFLLSLKKTILLDLCKSSDDRMKDLEVILRTVSKKFPALKEIIKELFDSWNRNNDRYQKLHFRLNRRVEVYLIGIYNQINFLNLNQLHRDSPVNYKLINDLIDSTKSLKIVCQVFH